MTTVHHCKRRTAGSSHSSVPCGECPGKAELTDLRKRINTTSCRPERETVTDASQGVQLATIQALAQYWGTDYDWRKCEAKLQVLPKLPHRDRRAGHSFHSCPLQTRKCIASHRDARMARLDHRTVEDHRSANQSHRTRRKCIRRVRRRNSVHARLRFFRQAGHDRGGTPPTLHMPGSH